MVQSNNPGETLGTLYEQLWRSATPEEHLAVRSELNSFLAERTGRLACLRANAGLPIHTTWNRKFVAFQFGILVAPDAPIYEKLAASEQDSTLLLTRHNAKKNVAKRSAPDLIIATIIDPDSLRRLVDIEFL